MSVNRLPPDIKLDVTNTSPAFKLAMREWVIGRYAPMRAYSGQIDGLDWAECYACSDIGFVQESGLKGKTCSRCELEIDSITAERAKVHAAVDNALQALVEVFRPSEDEPENEIDPKRNGSEPTS